MTTQDQQAPPPVGDTKPPAVDDRWYLVRWPGPGLLKTDAGEDVVLDGVRLRHVYPTKEFTLPGKALKQAKKLGLKVVRLASAER